jgi:hypothetical protein
MPPRRRGHVVAPAAHLAIPAAPPAAHQAVLAFALQQIRNVGDYFGFFGQKGILATIVVLIISYYFKQYMESGDPRDVCVANASSRSFLIHNVSVVMNEPYVPDSWLEGELQSIVGHAGKEYLVLVGPKGSGKSTIGLSILSDNKICTTVF